MTLAGWLSWLENHPTHQRFEGLIPGLDTYLGCKFYPQLGHVQETTDWCFSLNQCFSFFLSPFLHANEHVLLAFTANRLMVLFSPFHSTLPDFLPRAFGDTWSHWTLILLALNTICLILVPGANYFMMGVTVQLNIPYVKDLFWLSH